MLTLLLRVRLGDVVSSLQVRALLTGGFSAGEPGLGLPNTPQAVESWKGAMLPIPGITTPGLADRLYSSANTP
jgi:hypothetical protein